MPVRSWPCLAERVVADWPTTLRTSLLIAVTAIGIAVVMVAAFGIYGVVMLVGPAGLVLRHRRRIVR